MNKINWKITVPQSALLALLGGCLLLEGCALPDGIAEEMNVSADKYTQIEALDLDAMAVDSNAVASVAVEAPAELKLTLEEVRAITLENNLDLKVEMYNPKISETRVASTEARKYEAVFDSSLSYRVTDYNQDFGLFSSQRNYTDIGAGVTVPLESGGRVGVNVNDSSIETDGGPGEYSAPIYFSVSQPLLAGAGRREFMHELRVARYDGQKVLADTKLRMIEVVIAADTAYWDLYKKQKVLEVRQQQYQLAEAQLASAERMVDAGQSAPVEVLRAEAGLAAQRSSIIQAENDVRQSQRHLKYIMNKPEIPVAGPTELVLQTEADPIFYELDQDKLVSHALENRMELLQMELDLAKNSSTLQHLRNAKQASLSLTAAYGLRGSGSSRDDAYRGMVDRNSEEYQVGLNLSYPLGNKAAKRDLAGAVLSRAQLIDMQANKEALIRQEVYNALDGLETSRQQILANRQSAIVEGRLYEAEQRQFEISMRTSTDVLEAQSRFADSQSGEYEALANYQIALLELARSTGTLLGAVKVE
ncbi:MAG: TolC family protein [Pontiellaceae bacterium]|nr:TolC family protein [Pontiellaceae bacterium]